MASQGELDMLSKKYLDFSSLIFYQIYPRSFMDSDNDGIGDLKGIISKLDYLKDLGINAIWLSPCYKSPNDDCGYDISDYRDIMTEFGTLDDWKKMISEMHKRGIKLIMDLVANHSSTAHKWFQESRKSKDNPYSDYYYWADQPLNDWKACFGGSAWEYDTMRKQYYLHSYAISQADLNWENPQVRDEMKAVVDFWVKLGVDGFRCDVLDQISKDFPNKRNGNGPRLHEFIKELFGRPETKHIFTVGECWGADEKNICELTQSQRNELSTVFQFQHLSIGTRNELGIIDYDLSDLRDILVKWQRFAGQNDTLYTLFYENHDQLRFISKFGNDRELRYESATMFATMFFLLKGIPFLYQGQEIGETNSYSQKLQDLRDIQAINYYHDNQEKFSPIDLMKAVNFHNRDNARRPMAWDGSANGGFSKAMPWIPAHDRYQEINVAKDLKSPKSVYVFYQSLLSLRKSNTAVIAGEFIDRTGTNKNCFVYERANGSDHLLVICNFKDENQISVPGLSKGELLLSNYGRKSMAIDGKYQPYEIAVYKLR